MTTSKRCMAAVLGGCEGIGKGIPSPFALSLSKGFTFSTAQRLKRKVKGFDRLSPNGATWFRRLTLPPTVPRVGDRTALVASQGGTQRLCHAAAVAITHNEVPIDAIHRADAGATRLR